MKKRVRIKDIADKAGVSTGTVDRVLHNRGNVAADVKERVLKVVEELGYERNMLASALAYNKTVRISTLLPMPEPDLYWKQTDRGIRKAVKAVKHYGLVAEHYYFDYVNRNSFRETAKKMLESPVEGVLFPPMFADEAQWLMEECEKRNIAFVMINTNIPGSKPLCYIGQDSYQSGVLGGRLLSFGSTSGQTICILNLDYSTKAAHHLLEKERGFRDYFAEAGNQQVDIIRKDFEDFDDPEKLSTFLQELLQQNTSLSGIFVTNSRAYKVVEALPVDVFPGIKIVGFDLIEPNLEHLQSNKINFLINQNPIEQGYHGMMALFRHCFLQEKVERVQYLPLDIVVRENAEYYLNRQQLHDIVV